MSETDTGANAGQAAFQVPAALLCGVIEYLEPIRVILFGSRARGEAGTDSDWDLLVIVDDDTPREKRTLRAGFEATRAYGRAADVVPIRAACFAARKGVVNSLSWTADQEGVVVYDRP